MGTLIDRVHRDLTDEDIQKIASTYHSWRGEKGAGTYEDVPGFCKSASLEEIRKNGYVLTPGRYVGAEDVEDDGEPFEEKMKRLTKKLGEQFVESERLVREIKVELTNQGYSM
jgi:type I restriction enzyme M protein